MTDKEVAANFSFLTVDDALDDETTGIYTRRRVELSSTDTHGSKVFVWGLNDMRQLGTEISEAKVYFQYNYFILFMILLGKNPN